MPEHWQQAGFGLYVHWPFCQSKCPYCDFNSHVADAVDPDQWISAYVREIRRYAAETDGRILHSIYFGGGTPSLMPAPVVAAVIGAAASAWQLANDVEITLEANPGSAERDRFEGFRQAGVNRLSLGIQALNDADLGRLGRLHDAADGLAALDLAKTVFGRVSFDLIYARQNQTLAAWKDELGRALELAPDHLSLYQLTIEDGTAFGRRHRAGRLPGLPDEELGADLYALTQEMTAAAGLPAYEISNHARPGAESRHNLTYWRGGDWVGIGPGAHGRLTLPGGRVATETALTPARWLSDVAAGQGESRRETLSQADAAAEYLMMGLRLDEGIEAGRVKALMSRGFISNIQALENLGMIRRDAGRISATTRGRPVLNAVIRQLLPG